MRAGGRGTLCPVKTDLFPARSAGVVSAPTAASKATWPSTPRRGAAATAASSSGMTNTTGADGLRFSFLPITVNNPGTLTLQPAPNTRLPAGVLLKTVILGSTADVSKGLSFENGEHCPRPGARPFPTTGLMRPTPGPSEGAIAPSLPRPSGFPYLAGLSTQGCCRNMAVGCILFP